MNITIPYDVPKHRRGEFYDTFYKATGGSGRLMLFAGDQKVEHLNDDFYGEGIAPEDNDPEHMFKIASSAKIGVFATQFGLISRYAPKYPSVPYLVKLNSKTHLVPYNAKDPYSKLWLDVEDVVAFKKEWALNILGVGYTVYLGGEYEREMLHEAANVVKKAHENALLAVIWLYPKGPFVKDEHDPHLIAGAAGVAVCLGADFVKVKVPYDKDGRFEASLLKEATQAAGNTGVICEGGKKISKGEFIRRLWEQIHIGGARGTGTGRNIHQRPFREAVKMANAIYAVTVENASLEEALEILRS